MEVTFRLAAPLKLPNRSGFGKSWQAAAGRRASERKKLAWEVLAELKGWKPPVPFERVSIEVFRHGIRAPDYDNLYASVKGLLDVLQPASKRHPYGIGIIANDDANHLTLRVVHVQCKHRIDQGTVVTIRDLPHAAEAA